MVKVRITRTDTVCSTEQKKDTSMEMISYDRLTCETCEI